MLLTLPFPPSVNGMFLNMRGRGRVKAPAYRAWISQAGADILRQVCTPCFADHHRVSITIDLDDKRNGDADNRAKAVLDLLVTHRVIPGDSKRHVKRVSVGWERVNGCRVRITEAA